MNQTAVFIILILLMDSVKSSIISSKSAEVFPLAFNQKNLSIFGNVYFFYAYLKDISGC